MNWELIKHKFCRLAVTASLLLGGLFLAAAVLAGLWVDPGEMLAGLGFLAQAVRP